MKLREPPQKFVNELVVVFDVVVGRGAGVALTATDETVAAALAVPGTGVSAIESPKVGIGVGRAVPRVGITRACAPISLRHSTSRLSRSNP